MVKQLSDVESLAIDVVTESTVAACSDREAAREYAAAIEKWRRGESAADAFEESVFGILDTTIEDMRANGWPS